MVVASSVASGRTLCLFLDYFASENSIQAVKLKICRAQRIYFAQPLRLTIELHRSTVFTTLCTQDS